MCSFGLGFGGLRTVQSLNVIRNCALWVVLLDLAFGSWFDIEAGGLLVSGPVLTVI